MPYPPFPPPWSAFNGIVSHVAEWLRAPPPPPEREEDLRTCRFCREPFAAPLMCRTEAGFGWRILLRCGNCDCRREVLATDEQALRVERDVAGDIVAMRRALERLDRDRFAAQADAFVAALTRDLIDASDFA